MTLFIDNDVAWFSAVKESGRLYITRPLIWLKPYKNIALAFGNQICWQGKIWVFELNKTVQTEFGPLNIICTFTNQFPYYTYHFILTGTTTTRKKIKDTINVS